MLHAEIHMYMCMFVCIMFAVIMLFVRAKRYGPKIPLATISYLILFVKIHHGCVCVFDWMVTWVISSGSLHVHKDGYSHMEVWRQTIRVQRSANSICGEDLPPGTHKPIFFTMYMDGVDNMTLGHWNVKIFIQVMLNGDTLWVSILFVIVFFFCKWPSSSCCYRCYSPWCCHS